MWPPNCVSITTVLREKVGNDFWCEKLTYFMILPWTTSAANVWDQRTTAGQLCGLIGARAGAIFNICDSAHAESMQPD